MPPSLFRPRPVVSVVLGDIVRIEADAIVNAADDTLLGGTGVDGAIREAAGPELSEACRRLGRLNGVAKSTPGYALPARYVIHVAAPVHGAHLRMSHMVPVFEACLREAGRIGARRVAFPLLGAGAFGWDADDVAEAARIAIGRTARRHDVREVVMVAFGRTDMAVLERVFGAPGTILPGDRIYHAGSV